MTRTVDRKPISAAMKLAALKPYAIVRCAECYSENNVVDMQFDHHLALVDGGAHEIENIRPLCVLCHRKKSAREHKNNAKAKRVAKKHTNPLPPGTIKSRGFDKTRCRKMDGRVVPRNPASAV